MSDLFKKWLDKNKTENEETLKELNVKNASNTIKRTQVPTLSRVLPTAHSSIYQDPIPSTSRGYSQDPNPSTSGDISSQTVLNVTNEHIRRNEESAKKVTNPSDLVFENDALKLTIVSAAHKQERKFRLSDHMWHLLLLPKKQNKKMPLLTDILNFLYVAFNFMLQQLKKFYNPKDKNIAFMTITQTSMLNGLNSGDYKIYSLLNSNEGSMLVSPSLAHFLFLSIWLISLSHTKKFSTYSYLVFFSVSLYLAPSLSLSLNKKISLSYV